MARCFGTELRRLRDARGLSQPQLADVIGYSPSYISHLERGTKLPTHDIAARLDDALGADGALADLAPPPILAGPAESDPWETAELVRRLELSDVGHGATDKMHQTTDRLCSEYSWRSADELRAEAQQWLRYTARLLRGNLSLAEHREMLVVGGWLALLVGCLEHDMGMSSAAETTRAAAAGLGESAGHSEIVGWAWEVAAWMALTRNDPGAVLRAAVAGQQACHGHTVTAQLAALEAKGLARLRRVDEVHRALDRGYRLLTSLPVPGSTANHFVVDPSKWGFLAMDCYRVAGDDRRAAEYAAGVIEAGTLPDGTVRSPMRVSEARVTLAVVAARRGEVDEALDGGRRAMDIPRQSMPSLLLPMRELVGVLRERYPRDRGVAEFGQQVHTLAARVA